MPNSPDNNVLGSCLPLKGPPISRGEKSPSGAICATDLVTPEGTISGFRTPDDKLILTFKSSKGTVLDCKTVELSLNSPKIVLCGGKKYSVSLAANGEVYILPMAWLEQSLGSHPNNSEIPPPQTATATPDDGEAEQSIYAEQIRASLSQAFTPSPEVQKFIDASPAIVFAPLGCLLFWTLVAKLLRLKKK